MLLRAPRPEQRSSDGRSSSASRNSGLPAVLRIVYAPCRRRVVCKPGSGADRTRSEISTAVRADAAQSLLHAFAAERALEGADHGVGGRWRQILVAAFATGTQLKHGSPPQASFAFVAQASITVSPATEQEAGPMQTIAGGCAFASPPISIVSLNATARSARRRDSCTCSCRRDSSSCCAAGTI